MTGSSIKDFEDQYAQYRDDLEDQQMRDTLAVNLSYFILKSGDSQVRIAEKTGISKSALSSYAKGMRYPRPGQLRALADYFHVSVGELVDDPNTRSQRDNISNEARRIAHSFDELDSHGRELIRIIIQNELERMNKYAEK